MLILVVVTSDGIALFASVAHYLCLKNVRLLATTHFHEIFGFPLLTSMDSLAFYTLKTVQIEQGGFVHLYKLEPGKFEGSLGILCASKTGLKESIAQRARTIASAIEKGVIVSSSINLRIASNPISSFKNRSI